MFDTFPPPLAYPGRCCTPPAPQIPASLRDDKLEAWIGNKCSNGSCCIDDTVKNLPSMTCKGELQNPFPSLSLQMAGLMEKVEYLIQALLLGDISNDLLCLPAWHI